MFRLCGELWFGDEIFYFVTGYVKREWYIKKKHWAFRFHESNAICIFFRETSYCLREIKHRWKNYTERVIVCLIAPHGGTWHESNSNLFFYIIIPIIQGLWKYSQLCGFLSNCFVLCIFLSFNLNNYVNTSIIEFRDKMKQLKIVIAIL